MEKSLLDKLNIEKLKKKNKPKTVKVTQASDSSSRQKELEKKMKSREESPEVIEIDDDSDCDKKSVEDEDDDEYGLISAVEQARQLLAASNSSLRNLSKALGKSKSSTKRRAEQAPTTPGKQKRVELITLSSPKTKIK